MYAYILEKINAIGKYIQTVFLYLNVFVKTLKNRTKINFWLFCFLNEKFIFIRLKSLFMQSFSVFFKYLYCAFYFISTISNPIFNTRRLYSKVLPCWKKFRHFRNIHFHMNAIQNLKQDVPYIAEICKYTTHTYTKQENKVQKHF